MGHRTYLMLGKSQRLPKHDRKYLALRGYKGWNSVDLTLLKIDVGVGT